MLCFSALLTIKSICLLDAPLLVRYRFCILHPFPLCMMLFLQCCEPSWISSKLTLTLRCSSRAHGFIAKPLRDFFFFQLKLLWAGFWPAAVSPAHKFWTLDGREPPNKHWPSPREGPRSTSLNTQPGQQRLADAWRHSINLMPFPLGKYLMVVQGRITGTRFLSNVGKPKKKISVCSECIHRCWRMGGSFLPA